MWIIGFVWCVYNGEWFKRLFESLLLWIVQCYQNGDILLFVWTCHLNYFETWLWKVLCALRKNENLKRMYHFEGRIARRDGYYYRGSCRAPRQMHGQICPPWVPDWETRCVSLRKTCITIFDIASHGITHFYYWWTWIRVLLIFLVFHCETCEYWILSCYWEYVNW